MRYRLKRCIHKWNGNKLFNVQLWVYHRVKSRTLTFNACFCIIIQAFTVQLNKSTKQTFWACFNLKLSNSNLKLPINVFIVVFLIYSIFLSRYGQQWKKKIYHLVASRVSYKIVFFSPILEKTKINLSETVFFERINQINIEF